MSDAKTAPAYEGRTLGAFVLGARIGSGGMGEVYRARDTRLGREVAIKVLPPQTAVSADARQRFDREARAISQLNHPHICTLFDVGRESGLDFLVMELLDGETLAARLARGPLRLDELKRFSLQIAQALAAAHQRGIIHRDLKPGNIMITAAGIKLLDFGLAKPAKSDAPMSNVSTISAVTAENALVGTAPYMAPEVLQGRPADTRADLFAFGAVLFEMATNRAAFQGETFAALAAAILSHDPPPVSSIRPDAGAIFDRLVRECLIKDPAARWESAHDAALQLAAPDAAASIEHARGSRAWAGWVAAAVIAVGAAAYAWRAAPQPVAPAEMMTIEIRPAGRRFSPSIVALTFAVSPDGRHLAFSSSDEDGGQRGWVRRLDDIDVQALPGTEAGGTFAWSPDAKSLVFFGGGTIRRIDLATKSTVPLATTTTNSVSGSWGANGQILYASVEGQGIHRISAAGGASQTVITPDLSKGEARTQFPYFLPDGNSFLYLLRMQDRSGWLMLARPGAAPMRVGPMETQFAYLSSGWLVFSKGGVLLAERFDPQSGRLSGNPVAVAPQVAVTSGTAIAQFSASPSGTIVYRAEHNRSMLTWIDRTGRDVGHLAPASDYQYVRVSADGRRATISRIRNTGVVGLWSVDAKLGVETPLSPDENVTESNPIEVPNSGDVVFVSPRIIGQRSYRRSIATGVTEPATSSTQFNYALDISPDGTRLAYYEQGDSGRRSVFTTPLTGEKSPTPVRNAPPRVVALRYSPDGRHYLFTAFEETGLTLFVAPVEGGAPRAILRNANLARWSRDGRSIICLTADHEVVSVPIQTTPSLDVGVAETLFRLERDWIDFDTAPGGRILAIVPQIVADEQPLTAILNWRPPAE